MYTTATGRRRASAALCEAAPVAAAQGPNVGAGKLYIDEAALFADVATWEQERDERKALVKERASVRSTSRSVH